VAGGLSPPLQPAPLPRFSALLCLLAATAALSGPVRGAPAEGSAVVELPALMVSDSQNPLEWRYAAAPGLEVLSLCPDSTTKEFMRQFAALRWSLAVILPTELQLDQSVPMVHLLGETSMGDRLKQDVQAEMFQGQGTAKAASVDPTFLGRGSVQPRFTVLPNLRLMDTDAYAVFALLNDEEVRRGQLSLTDDYVSFLLHQRTPPLPGWFMVGTMGEFDALTVDSDTLQVAPFVWISDETSDAVRKTPATIAAALLPMEDLLMAPRPPAGPPAAIEAYRKNWIAQAGLFTRWALDGRSPGERKDYFKFVDRASREPVTEDQVRETFGLDCAGLRERLIRYLPTALDKTMRLRLPKAPSAPSLKLRPATIAESARIKGDWERMETAFVKRTYPALSGKYLDQARRTLHRAYDLGERDPQLLAALGLTECDAGDDAAALPYLTAAVGARVVRPRAYYELARILYARNLAKPEGAKAQLSAPQTTAVVEPLLSGHRQSPRLSAACDLFAELWYHSEVTPLPSDLLQLDQDTRFFPKDYFLSYETALLDAQAGNWPSAHELVNRSLRTAASPAIKARFAKLQTLLPPEPAAPSPPPAPAPAG
jgi:hypothetical protein